MRKTIALLVALLSMGVVSAQSVVKEGGSDIADTIYAVTVVDSAATMEGARTLALSRALGEMLTFRDTVFLRSAIDVDLANYMESYSIQTEVFTTKKRDGSFVARAECLALRKTVSETAKVSGER